MLPPPPSPATRWRKANVSTSISTSRWLLSTSLPLPLPKTDSTRVGSIQRRLPSRPRGRWASIMIFLSPKPVFPKTKLIPQGGRGEQLGNKSRVARKPEVWPSQLRSPLLPSLRRPRQAGEPEVVQEHQEAGQAPDGGDRHLGRV